VPHILIDPSRLRTLIGALFVGAGMRRSDAVVTADVLVWANERGVDSHGVSRVPIYLGEIERGELEVKQEPELTALLPAIFKLQAHRTAGPASMLTAITKGVELANVYGVSAGVVSEASHLGALGYYADQIATRGFAAVVMVAGLPFMAYHGASVRSLGTSPIAIGVPAALGTESEQLLVFDMASAVIAAGRISEAAAKRESLPDGVAIDSAGSITTDPSRAATVLPLGGSKGSGLATMFECLTGILAATPILTTFAREGRANTPLQNALVITLNVSAFRNLSDYQADVDLLVRTIKQLPRRKGFDELLLPGERGGREASRRKRHGIPVPQALWDDLVQRAAALGVSAPPVA
jgi:ureidoglycolate dehydrogenase (NAD+)